MNDLDLNLAPPHLTSEYFKTLNQQEKEKAWRDWSESCARIIKEQKESDEYYRRRIEEITTKILFGKIED